MKHVKNVSLSIALVVVLSIPVIAYASTVNNEILTSLKGKILTLFVKVDTANIKAEYNSMTQRVSQYIDSLLQDSKKEIADFKAKKEIEEINKIKEKEIQVKADLLKAKQEATEEAIKQIDNKVNVDVAQFEKDFDKVIIDKINNTTSVEDTGNNGNNGNRNNGNGNN